MASNFDRMDGALAIAAAAAALAALYVAVASAEEDDDGGAPDLGVCGNVKFITNTFKGAENTAAVCDRLGKKDQDCLGGANVRTWGPLCKDVQFESQKGPLFEAGGCRKFAERRDDDNDGSYTYHRCRPQGNSAYSLQCEAEPLPCDVPLTNENDPALTLLPCPQTKGAYGPRGVAQCATVDLPAGATCEDFVEKDIDPLMIRPLDRAQVQVWTRCKTNPQSNSEQACTVATSEDTEHYQCARLVDVPQA